MAVIIPLKFYKSSKNSSNNFLSAVRLTKKSYWSHKTSTTFQVSVCRIPKNYAMTLKICENSKSGIYNSVPGADPGLILGCCKILQKKLNIEMM